MRARWHTPPPPPLRRRRLASRLTSRLLRPLRPRNADQIVVLDETAKDLNVLRRSWGYGIRGQPTFGQDVAPLRNGRVSSLCAFTLRGAFVDWRHTDGTFDTQAFDHAIFDMFLPAHLPPHQWITATTPLVLIDNASIHHAGSLVNMINQAGGTVMFLAPYCWHLSPLDNGAFGLVVRWMKTHREYLCQYPLKTQLDLAFRHAVDPNGAYYCFRNCGYVAPFAFPGS